MKTITIYLFMMLFAIPGYAQMQTMSNTDEFNRKLAAEARNLESIESDFTQEKYLDVFAEKVISKGKFYYKKENKICLEYSRPLDYLIVINNARLKIVSDGKKNIMNLSSNKMMNQMQDMITACMVGDLSRLSSNYQLTYFEDSKYYLVRIKPNSKAVQTYINEMEIYIDKTDMSVHKLRLSETKTDYTEYQFRNKKFNTLPDEKIFAIR